MIKQNKRKAVEETAQHVQAKNTKFDNTTKAKKITPKGNKLVGDSRGMSKSKFGNAGKFGKPSGQSQLPNEKTDWSKFKKEKKELKLKRKQSKDTYEISLEAKQIFEELKCRRNAQKPELIEKLCNLICLPDVIKKIVKAHDMARVVQCMLKYGNPEQQRKIAENLLPLIVEMSTSKYSHFCVLRLLKYCSVATKAKIVDTLFGHIVSLACHSISSKILDQIYHNIATDKQRSYMRQEFYGDLYKKTKADNVLQLSDTYKDTPTLKTSILSAVKSNLDHVANKNLVDSSLVHSVLLEYLHAIDEDKIEEIVIAYTAHLPQLLTTKEGSKAAIECFYKSSSKNRRAIIKVIKEHLVKIATHEHGHIFLIVLINALDDTKATKKAIYDNLHAEVQQLMSDNWGRRVMAWLIAPADSKHFHPSFIAYVEKGLQFSKKDKELRRKEILEQIEAPLAMAIQAQPGFWISNRHIGLITAEIMCKLTSENFERAATALAAVIANSSWKILLEQKDDKNAKKRDVEQIIAENNKLKKQKKAALQSGKIVQSTIAAASTQPSIAGIEDAGLNFVLKKIITNDKKRIDAGETVTFGTILLELADDDMLEHWLIQNRGCFVLLNVLKSNNETVAKQMKKLLKPYENTLQQQSTSGANLLLEQLSL